MPSPILPTLKRCPFYSLPAPQSDLGVSGAEQKLGGKAEAMPHKNLFRQPYKISFMVFTKRLREGVRRGEITCSVRIWTRPHVKVGARYRMSRSVFRISLRSWRASRAEGCETR
jgi:hypothetical protein